jgi:hypothetical protein
MARRIAVAVALVCAVSVLWAAQGCGSTSAAPGACTLGGACSNTDLCMGIAGCESNCQCLSGTWQAPCPAALPQTGSACTPEGAYCGYTTSTNACGADNCYCQSGAWGCGPTCIIDDASTSADAGAGASGSAACVAAGGQCVRPGGGPCTLVGPEQACSPDQVGGTFCCAVAPDASCPDGGIQASNYDQTCVTDSDCVAISANESCSLCGLVCTNATINARAQAQYLSDIANTTASLTSQRMACTGDCGVNSACCVSGRCEWGTQCNAPLVPIGDAGTDAAADTGASDGATDGGADAGASKWS